MDGLCAAGSIRQRYRTCTQCLTVVINISNGRAPSLAIIYIIIKCSRALGVLTLAAAAFRIVQRAHRLHMHTPSQQHSHAYIRVSNYLHCTHTSIHRVPRWVLWHYVLTNVCICCGVVGWLRVLFQTLRLWIYCSQLDLLCMARWISSARCRIPLNHPE
jgi:hypothetical protein